MKEIKDSYLNYLFALGLTNSCFKAREKDNFEELKKMELNDRTILFLIREFNRRMIIAGDLINQSQRMSLIDIRDHFVVKNILFNMATGQLNSRYVLYTATINEIGKTAFRRKVLNPLKMVFIGIEGIDNSELLIPEGVTRIIDSKRVSLDVKLKVAAAILREESFGMSIKQMEELRAVEGYIADGVGANAKVSVQSRQLIRNNHTKFGE